MKKKKDWCVVLDVLLQVLARAIVRLGCDPRSCGSGCDTRGSLPIVGCDAWGAVPWNAIVGCDT